MRHRKKFNHLGRKSAHRQETLSSMATALILHKRITTTVAKAKALRVFVEPLITKSKVDSTHSRRIVFGYLGNKLAVSELFREVAQKVAERPGGYTRILKTGFRKGDSAEMCFIELVDYNANMLSTEEETTQKTTRRGGRRRKAGAGSEQSEVPTAVTQEVESDEIDPAEDDSVGVTDQQLAEEEVKSAAEEIETTKAKESEETTEAPKDEKSVEAIEEVAEEPVGKKPEEPSAETDTDSKDQTDDSADEQEKK